MFQSALIANYFLTGFQNFYMERGKEVSIRFDRELLPHGATQRYCNDTDYSFNPL